ncbi:hypothetical protein [Peribacillus frigoritolerans]|uniref:Uncharacterized protein n=1 Tax=Peribacillus castrilensis TaxID=2897690 RepID=A0AAW9N8V1_9BACI|nr:hypothetical protein [Peribacillus castrilensis]MEC0296563.1 hypothetical protein [Peribacillus castrilensis]
MNKLGFQEDSAQLLSQTKLQFRQRQMIPQGFRKHFQAAVFTQMKNRPLVNMLNY